MKKIYAKLKSRTELDLAPKTITKGQTHYNPYPEWMMIEDGYKVVQFAGYPAEEPAEGYYWSVYYEETTDKIIQKYEALPYSESED